MKITFIFSCSGMFRHVPECSGMFRNVPCSCFYRRPLARPFQSPTVTRGTKSIDIPGYNTSNTGIMRSLKTINNGHGQRLDCEQSPIFLKLKLKLFSTTSLSLYQIYYNLEYQQTLCPALRSATKMVSLACES